MLSLAAAKIRAFRLVFGDVELRRPERSALIRWNTQNQPV
jgi:hypothetical protein